MRDAKVRQQDYFSVTMRLLRHPICGGMDLKQTEKIRLICRILFVVYLIILFYFLFFAEAMGRVSDSGEREYIYNLELFKEIRRFLEYRDILGWKAVMLNLAGNVVAFVPFGSFLWS